MVHRVGQSLFASLAVGLMRLMYIHTVAIPAPQANTVHVMRMAEAFSQLGHEVEVITPSGAAGVSDVYAHYGVARTFKLTPLAPFARKGRGQARVFAAVAALAARLRSPDLVYTRDPLTAELTTMLGLDTVLELHVPPSAFGTGTQTACRRLIGRTRLKRLVVISKALAALVRRDLPGIESAGADVAVAHDGAVAGPPPPAKSSAGRLTAAYVGSFYQGRGIDVLLALARRTPEVDYRLIGASTEDLARHRADADALSNVTIEAAVPPASVTAELRSADVLLAPYQRELAVAGGGPSTSDYCSPLKVFEYMAAGRPMVISDLPVLREVLRPDATAVLVPPDDLDAWVSAVRGLAADPERRSRIGAAARTELIASHTWKARATEVLVGLGL